MCNICTQNEISSTDILLAKDLASLFQIIAIYPSQWLVHESGLLGIVATEPIMLVTPLGDALFIFKIGGRMCLCSRVDRTFFPVLYVSSLYSK